MDVIRDNAAVRRQLVTARRAGHTIGLVPTMGYLHAGHMSLIERARRECDRVVVSIFVNPTQFGPGEDFDRYPRDEARDLALCESAGADWIYAPSVDQLYPHGPGTSVVPPEAITQSLCGAFRPGHFTGVATVVAKLFALWQPDRAYFGLKDFQQTAVIRRMADDMGFGVEVVLVPTRREPDGLAMSSRNVYLSPEERLKALAIPRALQAGWETARRPGVNPHDVLNTARSVLAAEPALGVQYVELVDQDTLAPLEDLSKPGVLAVAAKLGVTRLIDNASLVGPAPLEHAGHDRLERLP
ncbi:MAG: pantoate--beta-alanine ligase [Candidatus Sericytochromatia bacterium]